nr:Dynein regulatory complex subunit 3 [Polyrhizophydium stewartii]
MSNYNNTEPTVIDEELIRKAINEQLNSEIAEIARKEGVEASEVTTLRLDYKNILKIDNLWVYENIVKLQLDNNIIEKIENINFLKNLQWLDLSFNNITQIEGLDGLVKLTDLTLYNNRISKIENLDDLANLQVFSIGNNNIQSLESLAYLIKFENLRVLNVAGNAFCKNPNYKSYCLAHMKRLKYLDYRLVDEESLKVAHEKYIDSIIAQEEEEKVAASKKEEQRKRAELDALHEKAHILHIDVLFDSMFGEDADFQKLVPIAPSIIYEMREEFRAKFEIVVKELKHFVLRKSQEKAEEIAQLRKCVSDVKGASDKECMKRFEEFQHKKKELIKVVQNSRIAKEVDEALKTLREETQTLSDFLMSAEMVIVEQFEEVIKEFERNYTEMCSAINETGQTSFARLRDLENEHQEKFSEAILAMYERFNKGDMDEVDDEIRDIMSDKDVLMNAINASHDFRLGKLDHQEDALVSGVMRDQEQVIKKVHDSEVRRNRDRISEIISFLDKCYQEIDNAEENAY